MLAECELSAKMAQYGAQADGSQLAVQKGKR